jgi:hypothetical protein
MELEVKNRITSNFQRIIHNFLDFKLSDIVEKIKEAIITQYDNDLVDVVTDRNSKTNPNYYREDFIKRLDDFEYIDKGHRAGSFNLNIPDMDNFDFSGRLRVIQNIMEGTAGLYVETNEDDYKGIFGKRPINEDPLDEYVPPKERIYLVRYGKRIRKAEKDLKKKFVKYPFSNTPPINILESGERYVEDNIGSWIDEALTSAQKQFVRNYQGARL